MFWFTKNRREKDRLQELKMAESQKVLLTAATETANAAQAVTLLLKARLDDALKQFEYTARILNDALFVCDMDGTIQASNPAARHMFGEQSLINRSILDLFDHNGKRLASASDLWVMIAYTSAWTCTEPSPLRGIKPANGQTFWIEPGSASLEWSDGTSSMLILVRNVDPIVSLRDVAREARHRFQSVFDLSFDGLMIEQDDRIVAANSSISTLFGYPTSELLGRPIAVLFVPEDHARIEANVASCHFTVHGLTATGALRSLIFTATQIQWQSRTARMISVKDVTEMTDLDRIASSKHDNGVDMICCYDAEYRITFVNKSFATLHQSERKDLLNKDVRNYLGAQDASAFQARVATLTADLPSMRTKVESVDALGRANVTDWIDHAVFDPAGNPVEYQRVGRDISEAVADVRSRRPSEIG